MRKDEFRLSKEQFFELRNDLHKAPSRNRIALALPAFAALAIIALLIMNPQTEVNPLKESQSLAQEDSPSKNLQKQVEIEVVSYQELADFEKELGMIFSKRKEEVKAVEKFQRWKKNKPESLVQRMANTRLRLKKLKKKIDS
ncbi:hypothetical protein LNTAR_21960 [Lentisphaera araneosa HTCC2155]|uniref:Uncharacterized protein n=1 Tax=Lentisphaera araneosa HTCC2155 TaxID=313628 RepID=A6DSK3_9BACT|nr:hypothetical protein [Lentisphaera araneosa]EDM25356.1 hypothetical protein LNTAR_21960 [Lentisphaera araneosa HTCC2155]